MKRLDSRDAAGPGRRHIIAAAAKRTQAIQERKAREQQEEQAALELKKRKEQKQLSARSSKSKQGSRYHLEAPETNADKPKVQKQSDQAKGPKRVSSSKKNLATCEEQEQPTTSAITSEAITGEIDRLKSSKQRTSISLQSKPLPKKTNEIGQLTKRDIQERNHKLTKYLEEKEQVREKQEDDRKVVTKDKKQQAKEKPQTDDDIEPNLSNAKPIEEATPTPPAWGYPKMCDSNGRPDCSTPCASSSESEDERFYRRMVGRYRATRYSIVEFIKSGAYAEANAHNNEPKPTKFK